MKKQFVSFGTILVGGMLFLGACHPTASNTSGLSIEKMEGFPAEDTCFMKGVSALYAGISDGQLVMLEDTTSLIFQWPMEETYQRY